MGTEYDFLDEHDVQNELPEETLEEEIQDNSEQEQEEVQDDSEQEQEEEVEPKKPKAGRPSAYNRIQEIQREKYQALDELRRAKEEIDNLKRFSSDLNQRAEGYGNAALIHYENSANLRLEQAKTKAIRASEDGDMQAMIDANVEIASIAAERQRINEYKEDMSAQSSQDYKQPGYVNNEYQQPKNAHENIQPDQRVADEWLSNNSWFSAQSEDYNPDLVEAVNQYSEKLENLCYRQGRPDLIMSREYFQEISNYVQSMSGNSGRQLNMKPVRGSVASVKGRTSQSVQQKKQIQLSADDKDMARKIGVKDEVFLQYKLADVKNQKERGRPYGSY